MSLSEVAGNVSFVCATLAYLMTDILIFTKRPRSQERLECLYDLRFARKINTIGTSQVYGQNDTKHGLAQQK